MDENRKTFTEKVKVVIDMPSRCRECPFAYYTEGCYSDCCNLIGRNFEETKVSDFYKCDEGYMEKRPDWCPLNSCERI